MADLLLHSLSEFRELIDAVLAATSPTHVIEIGSESGRTTERLAAWASAHAARITTIDPAPAASVLALAAQPGSVHTVLAARSPDALVGLAAAGVYLVDGDHNYSVVSRELAQIHAATTSASVAPVVFAHDVGWPSARRDSYFDPGGLPPEQVHPHSFELRVHLEAPEEVTEGGFGSAGHFALALTAGGPRNGVLTAVEDFLVAHADWELHVVPAVFGLGVLFPRAHPQASALRALLAPYTGNALLARVDENRLRNWLEVRRLQDREQTLEAARRAIENERDALARRVTRLEAELADARWLTRARRWLGRKG